MALDITDSIRDNQHILVEAGVGIGKSLAYLVPLLYYFKEFNEPIAIATSTIALQEQLEKDIKYISQLLLINVPTVIAKGQTHFVCRIRLKQYAKEDKDYEIIDEIISQTDANIAYRKKSPF